MNTSLTFVLGLIISSVLTSSVQAATCSAHPQKLRGTIQARVDLRNGVNWIYETINGSVELTLNPTGTGYMVTSLNGQSAVQGNVQGCWVSANTPLTAANAAGTLTASSTITAQGTIVAQAFGQIDMIGNFWSLSNCPWGQSTSIMNHLGPLLGTGPSEMFACDVGVPARFVGSSNGTISTGGRAQYIWNLNEVVATP